MATYSLIQYDVLKDVMYFKGTPNPGFEDSIEDGGFNLEANQELIQGATDASNILVPTSASVYLTNFLTTIPEIDLNNSLNVVLNLTIVEGIRDTVSKIYITSFNNNKTTSYAVATGASFPDSIIDLIKPIIKYPPLGKCRNCLKFTWDKSNAFSFVGNLGGQWDSTLGPNNNGYINNQKAYRVTIPNYTAPNSPSSPSFTDYIAYWRVGLNFSGTDYNGAPFTVTGNRWILNPESQLNTINTKTFFHVLSGSNAPCPYTPPSSTWYNYFGTEGFFLLENVVPAFSKICPDFYSYPASGSDTGSLSYNCSDNGCVIAATGSIGQYATLAECEINCDWPGTGSGYDCTPNGCVISTGSGVFATLAECEAICNPPITSSCFCDPITNLVINGDFSNGGNNWIVSPSPFTPGIGSINFTSNVIANVGQVFNSQGTSSLSLTQLGILQPSCSYTVCFEAYAAIPNPSASISIATGDPSSPAEVLVFGNLTNTPTAFTLTLDPAYTTDLTFYFGLTDSSAPLTRIYVDNICVTNTKCPPPTTGSAEDCVITGSADIYEEIEYECICPEGYTPDGSGSCVSPSSSILYSSASSGIIYTQPFDTFTQNVGGLAWGASLLQPTALDNFFQGMLTTSVGTSGGYPWFAGSGHPNLYYEYNFNGTANSSTGNPSPIEANPNKWKTQYTFDILKSEFWNQPSLDPFTSWYDRWIFKLIRNPIKPSGNPSIVPLPSSYGASNSWYGMGTTINNPSTKTYYIGVVAMGTYRVKINGTDIICTSPNPLLPNPSTLTPLNYPAYAQLAYARIPTANFGNAVFQLPFYSYNQYLPLNNYITGSTAYFGSQGIMSITYGTVPATPNGTTSQFKFYSGASLSLYPVTLPSGCFEVTIENNPDFFKQCSGGYAGIGAIIFDNTAAELANATDLSDLNIVWDTSVLPSLGQYETNQPPPNTSPYDGYPMYMYGYPASIPPPTSSYVSYCPTGSSEIVSGSPCLGCTGYIDYLPCGGCLECVNGRLYNGYVVDKGGYTLQGRGPGGIVNIDAGDNPINTWIVPSETEWNDLVTTLNGSTITTTAVGALGTNAVGGKLKDYTRNLIATCWENPNIGAQTNANASGWAGTAGGKRLTTGTYEGLGFEGIWWSANSNSPSPELYTRELKHYSADVFRELKAKNYGLSLRLCRPAVSGEVNGNFVLDAYVDNSGTIYDGVVIGNYVWITKNLGDGFYNNGSSVTSTLNTTNWSNAISTAASYGAVYNNDYNNTNILVGNYNPLTHQCYDFPTYYVYQKCGAEEYLVQDVSGSTTTPGEVQKDSNNDCWSFVEFTNGNPNLPVSSTITYTGNYFSSNPTVYADCEECSAIHTIYMSFTTKNC
jgi:hypothetical protein